MQVGGDLEHVDVITSTQSMYYVVINNRLRWIRCASIGFVAARTTNPSKAHSSRYETIAPKEKLHRVEVREGDWPMSLSEA